MKIRIISAIFLLVVMIPLIWLGGYPFAIAMGIMAVLGYKEVLSLKKSHKKIPNLVKILGLISVVYIAVGNYGLNALDFALSYPRILLPFIILLFPTIFYKDKYTTGDAFYLIGSIFLVGLISNLMIVLRNIDLGLLLYLLGVSVFTDIFAYGVGCLIGKHKMAPSISPLKSWEGAIGGLIGGSAVGVIVYSNLVAPFSIKILIITIILSVMGQLGDLIFSRIKRENNIKDFSNIIPGHGGVLDRIDNLAYVIFTYVIIAYFL